MGRIIFDSRAFAPGAVKQRTFPDQSGGGLKSQWLSPSGVQTMVGLAGILGKMKLPRGLGPGGVDAEGEALRAAAEARAGAKAGMQGEVAQAQQAVEAQRAMDRPALEQAQEGMGEEFTESLQNEARRRAVGEANAILNRSDDPEDRRRAADILMQVGERQLATQALMPAASRQERRREMETITEADRLKRRGEQAAGFPAHKGPNDWLPEHDLSYSELGRQAKQAAGLISPEADAELLDDITNRAKRTAGAWGDRPAGNIPYPPIAEPVAFKFQGLTNEDLKSGSDRLKNLTRAQLRDVMFKWKSASGKPAIMMEMAKTGADTSEANMFEELLHREIRQRARQDVSPDQLAISRPSYDIEEARGAELDLVGKEAADEFLAQKRSEDPYYGMSPGDAIDKIMEDAPNAKSEKEQAKLKSLLARYTARNKRTFSDLFFDSSQARLTRNTAQLDRLMPEPTKELSELEQLRLDRAIKFEKWLDDKGVSPEALKVKKLMGEVSKANRAARSAGGGGLSVKQRLKYGAEAFDHLIKGVDMELNVATERELAKLNKGDRDNIMGRLQDLAGKDKAAELDAIGKEQGGKFKAFADAMKAADKRKRKLENDTALYKARIAAGNDKGAMEILGDNVLAAQRGIVDATVPDISGTDDDAFSESFLRDVLKLEEGGRPDAGAGPAGSPPPNAYPGDDPALSALVLK